MIGGQTFAVSETPHSFTHSHCVGSRQQFRTHQLYEWLNHKNQMLFDLVDASDWSVTHNIGLLSVLPPCNVMWELVVTVWKSLYILSLTFFFVLPHDNVMVPSKSRQPSSVVFRACRTLLVHIQEGWLMSPMDIFKHTGSGTSSEMLSRLSLLSWFSIHVLYFWEKHGSVALL